MRLEVVAFALLLAGFGSSIAVAQGSPPGRDQAAPAARTPAAAKTSVCHRTGSAKRPYRLVSVPRGALEAHMRHGDLLTAASGGCATTTPGVVPAATAP